MSAKQLSVFIENRQGRLVEVLQVLKESNISILSMSLADTTEYGLLRLIVNDPEICKEKLSAAGFSTLLTRVLVVKLTHKSGSLQDILRILAEANIGIEYMYGLSIDGAEASVVMKTTDLDAAQSALTAKGIGFLSGGDISKM